VKVIEPGHHYQVEQLDWPCGAQQPLNLIFVNREDNPHPGSQTQEYIRVQIDMLTVLIDRTNHCDACLRWEGNDKIIKHFSEAQRQLRLALLLHEQRALERKVDKQGFKPEKIRTGDDGHFDEREL
jgi:hypothetical protein